MAHFVFAGHETTTNLIGNGLRALLLEHRDEWGACADAALVSTLSRSSSATTGPCR